MTALHTARFGSAMTAPCDCPAGTDHDVGPDAAPPTERRTSAWWGDFRECSALLCELPEVRTMAWDSPGHMPWVGVSLTPCPDVDGAPIRLENYSCRLKHLHWGRPDFLPLMTR